MLDWSFLDKAHKTIEQFALRSGQSKHGPQTKVHVYRLVSQQQIAYSDLVSRTEISLLSLQFCRSYSDLNNNQVIQYNSTFFEVMG